MRPMHRSMQAIDRYRYPISIYRYHSIVAKVSKRRGWNPTLYIYIYSSSSSSDRMATMVSPRGDKNPSSIKKLEELEGVNRELKGIHFKAVTAYNRMKDDVSKVLRTDETRYYSKVGGDAHTFGELAKEFRRVLEEHPSVKDEVSTQKIVRDFQNVLHRSEGVMKAAKEKEQRRQRVEGDTLVGTTETTSSSGVQEMAALVDGRRIENQVQYNEGLIEERDRAITEITGQIGEVHQIFQDLAVLVHDQGEMVDDIEANLTRASHKTHDAHTQLIRAERSQRRATSTWCFLAMLAGGAIGVLLLIVLV